MKTRATGLDVASGGAERKRLVNLAVSQLAFEALAGEERGDSTAAPVRTEIAVRVYLGDRDAGQPAWPYPKFLQGSETREDVGLALDVDADLWLQFEAEAKKQGVSVQQLLEHAAFYFAAELSAGRITQRILDDLDATEPKGDAS
jgi:hypothetical protein